MPEMRQLLRYEIPGLLVFIYTILMILFFIKLPSSSKDLMEVLSKLFIALAIIAIPLGWLIYQIYDAFHPKYYNTDSIKLLQKWIEIDFPKGKRAKKETCLEELVNFFLIGISENNKRYERLIKNLDTYWDHYDARFVIGKLVPIISIVLTIIAWFFLKLNYNIILICTCCRFLSCILLALGIVLFSWLVIYKPRLRVLDEINTLQCFLILLNKKDIKFFKEKYLDNRDDIESILRDS